MSNLRWKGELADGHIHMTAIRYAIFCLDDNEWLTKRCGELTEQCENIMKARNRT